MNDELMEICKKGLPENTEDYIPDLVHDFIHENWDKLFEVMEK